MAGWRPRIPKFEREVESGDGAILFGFDGFNEAKIIIFVVSPSHLELLTGIQFRQISSSCLSRFVPAPAAEGKSFLIPLDYQPKLLTLRRTRRSSRTDPR
jgi:hypothetical protein